MKTSTMINLQDAYTRFGLHVNCYNDDKTPNTYFIGGEEVSREDAWKHIRAQLGK